MSTPMRVKKVIVDELPPDCYSCKYMKRIFKCDLTMNKITDRDYDVERPSHCPLQIERTCGNCKHLDEETSTLVLCGADNGLVAVLTSDYCSKWEARK